MKIQVVLPFHLRNLAQVEGDLFLEIEEPATIGATLEGIEKSFPVLKGTIRDHSTLKRRPFIRFFVCKEDWSNEAPDKELPLAVLRGEEPFLVVGAMAGG